MDVLKGWRGPLWLHVHRTQIFVLCHWSLKPKLNSLWVEAFSGLSFTQSHGKNYSTLRPRHFVFNQLENSSEVSQSQCIWDFTPNKWRNRPMNGLKLVLWPSLQFQKLYSEDTLNADSLAHPQSVGCLTWFESLKKERKNKASASYWMNTCSFVAVAVQWCDQWWKQIAF